MRRFAFVLLMLSAVNVASFGIGEPTLPIPRQVPQGIDFWNPANVGPVLKESLQAAERKPKETRIFYSLGVGHFDDFLPVSPDMLTDEPAGMHQRLTFHDGRIAKCEQIDAAGMTIGFQDVRYDRREAPFATGWFKPDGSASWYKYAVYDAAGRLGAIYTFGDGFDLRWYEEFTYRGEALDIHRRDRDKNLTMVTTYEDGGLFLTIDGAKNRVNTLDRNERICEPEKLGLKPLYPGVFAKVEADVPAK